MRCALGVACALGAAATATAQGLVSLVPFEYSADVYVTDSTADKLYGFSDLNMDGDFADAGEEFVFYDDTLGPLPLSNPSGLAVGNGARFYVADRGMGQVLRFVDLDGDRNAHGAGEAMVFFDGNPLINQSGLTVDLPVRLLVDAFEIVWVTESNASGAGEDGILRLQDLNFDGDANDAGEAVRFYEPDPGSVAGDTIVLDLIIGMDGFAYYLEGSTTGFRTPGLYRLDDKNGNGVIHPMSEVENFFALPPLANPAFLQAGGIDGSGYFYLTDTGNDVVWRVRDENGDGDANDAGEAVVYYTSPMVALYWDVAPLQDGRVLVCGENGQGELILLDDMNGNGVIDLPTEAQHVFVSPNASVMPNPRAAVWELRPTLEVPPVLPTGGVGSALLITGSSDWCWVYFSFNTVAPFALPPFGFLQLDISSPNHFFLLKSGQASIAGTLPFGIAVPNLPQLIGATVFLQAAAGKADRVLLSNLQTLLIQ